MLSDVRLEDGVKVAVLLELLQVGPLSETAVAAVSSYRETVLEVTVEVSMASLKVMAMLGVVNDVVAPADGVTLVMYGAT